MKGRFKNILCVITDTHEQDEIVAHAIHIAKRHQAELTIMLALEPLPPNARMVMESFSYLDSQRSMVSTAEDWIETKAKEWGADYPLKGCVKTGELFVEVIKQVTAQNHDLVIKLTDNALLGRLFGNQDMHILRKSPCPVWLMHQGQSRKYKKIFAAVDVNYHYPEHEVSIRRELNMDILRHAAQIALMEFAQLNILHVYDVFPDHVIRSGLLSIDNKVLEQDLAEIRKERNKELKGLVKQLKKEMDKDVMEYLKPKIHLIHGNAKAEIADTTMAFKADALVLGTVTRLGVPGFVMGNTADDVLHRVDCSVLGVKPRGFQAPNVN